MCHDVLDGTNERPKKTNSEPVDGMPKYAYPEHVYASHHRNDFNKDDSNGIRAQANALTLALSDKRVAQNQHDNDNSSSTSEEEGDFFSNKELID